VLHDDGTYDLKYTKGDVDVGVEGRWLKPWIKPSRKRKSDAGAGYEVVQRPVESWDDYYRHGNIDPSAIISSKRPRKPVLNKK